MEFHRAICICFKLEIILNLETAKHCDVIENSPVKKVTSNVNGRSDKPVVKFYHVFLVVLSGIVLFN